MNGAPTGTGRADRDETQAEHEVVRRSLHEEHRGRDCDDLEGIDAEPERAAARDIGALPSDRGQRGDYQRGDYQRGDYQRGDGQSPAELGRNDVFVTEGGAGDVRGDVRGDVPGQDEGRDDRVERSRPLVPECPGHHPTGRWNGFRVSGDSLGRVHNLLPRGKQRYSPARSIHSNQS
ncbi:MAG: hypothetical protein LH475_00665 [Cryobacterium sp.]|uniref:hypothetical protein n=1 Tax=unclassified Cryobacterium TaxID=2649013 RepID=UPI0018CA3F9D|nr:MULTISPECIES: hypothetical protein [unclassified Cryobacterium]MCY7403144.1 hypothetical protein [Cryobacterium sp.]MEC5153808.1 hypothetical protein [Cryobacterium sp. CAN_C3]